MSIYIFKRDKNGRREDVCTAETETEARKICTPYSVTGLEWTRDAEYGK